MSVPPESPREEEEEFRPQAHHPSAPSHELFDIITTVDPSYVISLIRKLLPTDLSDSRGSNARNDPVGLTSEGIENDAIAPSENGGVQTSGASEYEAMHSVEMEGNGPEAIDERSNHNEMLQGETIGEAAWEEYGCVLWDLAASETHAELMVQNLILEVLLSSILISRSARITEISLGILGNIACHEAPRKKIPSTNGLIQAIVDQLFSDDSPCLCDACRLITLCLQSDESIFWVEALQPEHILLRIFWIVENTLNLQLMEKSLGLLLAILESKEEVVAALRPSLMKLGLPSLLSSLFSVEMIKLKEEQVSERYFILDVILQTFEALSTIDDYSQEICSNKDLFWLLVDLIKLPDKTEGASSCVTAAVLIANILTDAADLASKISQDLDFLQGLFDTFMLASDDREARDAIWSIFARLLVLIQESELSPSKLYQYVSLLSGKSDLIEEELLEYQLSVEEHENSASTAAKWSAKTIAMKKIFSLLNHWKNIRDDANKILPMDEYGVNERDIDKLLSYSCRYFKSREC